MKNIFLYICIIPIVCVSQTINEIDSNGNKQGVWSKYYKNGNLRYKGQFRNDKPEGLFFYYYDTGELKVEKEFFHPLNEKLYNPLSFRYKEYHLRIF